MRIIRKKKQLRLRHLLIILFLLYVGYTVVSQYVQLWDLSCQEKVLKEQLEQALKERDELKREIELLHTDDYIERVARDELGLVKSGEYIFKTTKTVK